MKKATVAILSALVVGLLLFFNQRDRASDSVAPANISQSKPATQTDAGAQVNVPAYKTEEEENAVLDAKYRTQRERELKEMQTEQQQAYSTSIVFYGIVLDLRGQAVTGAQVKFMNADPTGNWTWKDLVAGDDGSFTIRNVRGRYLDVRVDHPGYYKVPESKRSFTYAGNDRGPDFKPNPAKPEIFRLKKKGEAAELVRQYDRVLFTKEDGHARSFSLYDHSRRRDQPDYVILQGVDTAELDRQGKPIRRLEMVVPKGGIQQRTDPFAFTAPTGGYQPSMYFMRPEFGGKFDYFVKFDNGNYGRFTIMGTGGDYLIESYFNPDRSPNLEYDPEKEITFVRTGRMGIDLVYPAKDDPPKKPR